jgi:hypothetical protein
MAAAKRTPAAKPGMEAPGMDALSPEEVLHRVGVLKRFREMLQAQRDRFQAYLDVLDKQKDVIEQGDTDDLTAHVDMEEKIVADIFSIQKVIDPLEDMYQALFSREVPPEAGDVPDLKNALEGLKVEAVSRVRRNKDLLSKRMEHIRSEIKNLRKNPYAARRSVYADAAAPALIDIEG